MKIINEPMLLDFEDLKAGDTFYVYEFGVFMKTQTKGTCNAVNLSNGEFIECMPFCQVQPIDCELVIK